MQVVALSFAPASRVRPRQVVAQLCGAGEGIRTLDVLLGKQIREKAGTPCLLSRGELYPANTLGVNLSRPCLELAAAHFDELLDHTAMFC